MSTTSTASTALVPSVRSRLWASVTSFALGFAMGIFGTIMISRPDQWLWIAVSIVLMVTGALGILFADTARAISVWAIVGFEVFAVFTAVPLLWIFTVATTPDGLVARNLLPQDISWSTFGDVLGSDLLRHAALTSFMVAAIATLIAIPLALPAAYALVRLPVRGRRVVHGFVLAALLAPLVAFAGPLAQLLIGFGRDSSRLALVPSALIIALPLAIWLSIQVIRDVPWALQDAVRADGATRWQVLTRFAVPAVGPGAVVVALLVFVVACQDFVLGAALSSGDPSRPLPATLLLATGQLNNPSATVAATGLLWMLPSLAILLVFSRRISHLLGRSPR